MSPSPKPYADEQAKEAAAAEKRPLPSRQPSRIGTVLVGAHLDPKVKRILKGVAAAEDTTVQVLIATAINDLLEKRGFGRPASEAMLPRGKAPRGEESER